MGTSFVGLVVDVGLDGDEVATRGALRPDPPPRSPPFLRQGFRGVAGAVAASGSLRQLSWRAAALRGARLGPALTVFCGPCRLHPPSLELFVDLGKWRRGPAAGKVRPCVPRADVKARRGATQPRSLPPGPRAIGKRAACHRGLNFADEVRDPDTWQLDPTIRMLDRRVSFSRKARANAASDRRAFASSVPAPEMCTALATRAFTAQPESVHTVAQNGSHR